MKQSSRPIVTTIVLTWNSENFIDKCLQSLLNSDYPTNILVVDNDSADNTRNEIAKRFPMIQCINTGANIGYAGGNNFGMRKLMDGRSDYFFILNPDAYIDTACLGLLIERMEHETELAAASPMIYQHTSGKIWYAGSHINWKNGQTPHIGYNQIDAGQFNNVTHSERLNGCALLLRKSYLKTIGLMDENYFLYYEETDWSVACANAGFKLGFVPKAKTYHAVSASTGGFRSPIYEYYMTRNKLYFMHKYKAHASHIYALRILYYHTYVLLTQLKSSGVRSFLGTLRYQLKGTIDYFAGRFGRQEL